MREPLSGRLRGLRSRAPLLLQSAVATAAAWAIAADLLGHTRPIFAPLSAIIAIGTSHAQRSRRTVELIVGVAVGIAVADLAVGAIGTGVWQLLLITLLAMAIAVVLDTGPLFVTQAGVSAALVVTVQPPGSGLSGQRFLDALIGGVVALAITSLLPVDPLREIRSVARAARRGQGDARAGRDLVAVGERPGRPDPLDGGRPAQRPGRGARQRPLGRARGLGHRHRQPPARVTFFPPPGKNVTDAAPESALGVSGRRGGAAPTARCPRTPPRARTACRA